MRTYGNEIATLMKLNKILLLILMAIVLFACKGENNDQANTSILPTPKMLESQNAFSSISSLSYSDAVENELGSFVNWINDWPISSIDGTNNNLKLYKKEGLENGTYQLEVSDSDVSISYFDQTALRHALSSLSQLLFLNDGKLPIVKISDEAGLGYRGMHLDVSRHMYTLDEIKKYIDYLSFYKMNTFHWHLTDDQGWRIEIKKYPKLQEISAYRPETLIGHYNDQPQKFDGKRYGGYYSQDQIKEVVQYAGNRGIEVIPEIDIPGHTSAIIAAYPELSCDNAMIETATKWGVFFDVLCPTEASFEFLEGVFSEVIELFPSKYIHIGGDECPKERWKESLFCQQLMRKEGLKDELELQSYFIKRVEKFINSKGKQIIGWDEILEGGVAPNATIMSWRGIHGGIEAAKAGHDVIMTPTSHCYFDYYQSENKDEPLAIGGFTNYQKVYNYQPIPEELNAEQKKYILGAQGNVWTEYLKEFKDVEYMFLTRMITLSEVLWGKNSKDIQAFSQDLFKHTLYWQNKGVNMANHLLNVSSSTTVSEKHGVNLSVESYINSAEIFIKKPGEDSYTHSEVNNISLDSEGDYSFYAQLDGKKGSDHSIKFEPHKGNHASIALKSAPAEKYSGNGPQSVINGIYGFEDRYGGSEWLGFSGSDFDGMISFPEAQIINSISFKLFKGEGQWIYLPKSIKIFDNAGELLVQELNIVCNDKIARVEMDLKGRSLSKMQIVVENYGIIPANLQGGGNPSWLFIDEIQIN